MPDGQKRPAPVTLLNSIAIRPVAPSGRPFGFPFGGFFAEPFCDARCGDPTLRDFRKRSGRSFDWKELPANLLVASTLRRNIRFQYADRSFLERAREPGVRKALLRPGPASAGLGRSRDMCR